MRHRFFSIIIIAGAILLVSFGLRAQTTKPDLILEDIIVKPLQPAPGQPATITIKGKFEGTNPRLSTTGFKNYKRDFPGFYFDGSINTEPAPTVDNPINPGDYFYYIYSGAFSDSGVRTLRFSFDETDELDEYSEQNNSKSKVVTMFNSYNLPDLKLESVATAQTSVATGKELTVTVTGTYTGSEALASSQGIGSLQASFGSDFTPSTSLTPSPNPLPTESSPLASGSAFVYSFSGSYSTTGQKTVTFSIDTANELYESNELNNTISLIISVTSEPTQEPEQQPEQQEPPQEPEREISQDEWVEHEKTLVTSIDAKLTNRLKGRILLQVDEHGEAWYVNQTDGLKYYMKDGATAYEMLRTFGLGIRNNDLARIPVGLESRFEDTDSDSDRLPDKLEEGLKTDPHDADSDDDGVHDGDEVLTNSTNPLGTGSLVTSPSLVSRLTGRILLQVESRGEAWYINPADGKRYYMKDGPAAYQIMRFLSLGISNTDLRKIAVGDFTPLP